MNTHVTLANIGLRLLLAVLAGLAIGFDRSEHGKVAGMRTTVLVCVSAAVAMIQVNLLLPTAGRPSDSFVMNDLMRFPLGILTGVGFIGAGAILRRDNVVVGVTTAATLWLMTVVGLCFGGGQLWLGGGATTLGLCALQGLKLVERRLCQEFRAKLSIVMTADGPAEDAILSRLRAAGMKISGSRLILDHPDARRELVLSLKYYRLETETETPAVVTELSREPGVTKLYWDAMQ
jgi:putative Mg2+ transporter-C (MgtC) family protein